MYIAKGPFLSNICQFFMTSFFICCKVFFLLFFFHFRNCLKNLDPSLRLFGTVFRKPHLIAEFNNTDLHFCGILEAPKKYGTCNTYFSACCLVNLIDAALASKTC